MFVTQDPVMLQVGSTEPAVAVEEENSSSAVWEKTMTRAAAVEGVVVVELSSVA